MSELDPKLREALDEVQSYLADRLAPLLVADSIEMLIDYPPELTGEQLRLWALYQHQMGAGSVDLADVLFHALKKVQLLEELNLVPRDRFETFLGGVAKTMAARCPPEAKERFVQRISHLRETVGQGGRLVGELHRAAEGLPAARAMATASAEAPLSPEEIRDLRRFKLLLERAGSGGGEAGSGQQMLVLAAAGAKSPQELEARLKQLHEVGVGPAFGRDLVRSLVSAVPDWALATPDAAPAPSTASLEAVRRAVRLAGDGARSGERWKDLLRVAAEEFNRRSFGRAVTLVELAERMVKEGEVDMRFAEMVKSNAHEAYDITVLLQATTEEIHRPVVRRLLEAFPGWAPRELLDDLAGQPDQKRRRLQLALLELWGADARPVVFDRLVTTLGDSGRDPHAWWYQRNLVYLLHRIPRTEASDAKQEVELVGPFSTLVEHPSFQKETFLLLAASGDAGIALLSRRLAEAERALEASTPPPHSVEEVWKILSSLTSALVRSGTSSGLRVAVDHALARRPRSGETLARLRELASFDLSREREVVAKLLAALREATPKKVLGFRVGGGTEDLAHLARALSGTRAPEVRAALAEIEERFPDLALPRPESVPAGGAAPQAPVPRTADDDPSQSFVPETSRASLSGDLAVFGLPGLIQNLQQSESSGTLVLRDAQGSEVGSMKLHQGQLVACRTGRLSGPEAFYQLFEVAQAASFAFAREDGSGPTKGERFDLMALLMEAMRRVDELQGLRALVPDGAFLKAGTERPTTPAEESDGELVRKLWLFVRSGATAIDCDRHVEVDSYRARSLLAHWLEGGALDLEGLPL
ncbi:MAG: DUF4388 domain-containing protein [Holophagales bacterium]|nr:DUF4388 domain-containing protein [Holophagales bacterium]